LFKPTYPHQSIVRQLIGRFVKRIQRHMMEKRNKNKKFLYHISSSWKRHSARSVEHPTNEIG
jgi:hypothetical protein